MSLTKINSKWTIDLNIKHKTVKLLADNMEGNLDDLRMFDDFLEHQRHNPREKQLTTWASLKSKYFAC